MELDKEDLPQARSGKIDRFIAREGGVIAMFVGSLLTLGGAALAVFGRAQADRNLSLNQVKAAGILAAGAGTALTALGKSSYSSARDANAMEAVREVLEEESITNRLLSEEEMPATVTINIGSREQADGTAEKGMHVARLERDRAQKEASTGIAA